MCFLLNRFCRYADLWEAHLRTALLDALPEAQRHLDVDDNPLEPSMSAFTFHSALTSAFPGADICGYRFAVGNSHCARSYASRIRARSGRVPSSNVARVCHFVSSCPALVHLSFIFSIFLFLAFMYLILMLGINSGTTLQAQKGHIVLTPYAVVQQLLTMGLVELV